MSGRYAAPAVNGGAVLTAAGVRTALAAVDGATRWTALRIARCRWCLDARTCTRHKDITAQLESFVAMGRELGGGDR